MLCSSLLEELDEIEHPNKELYLDEEMIQCGSGYHIPKSICGQTLQLAETVYQMHTEEDRQEWDDQYWKEACYRTSSSISERLNSMLST